jgi:hypothetical protein
MGQLFFWSKTIDFPQNFSPAIRFNLFIFTLSQCLKQAKNKKDFHYYRG